MNGGKPENLKSPFALYLVSLLSETTTKKIKVLICDSFLMANTVERNMLSKYLFIKI